MLRPSFFIVPLLAGLCAPLAAQLTPVFEYKFPASYDGSLDLAPVVDQSAAGHDGTIHGEGGVTVALSDDVPSGQPAGTRSLDLFNTPGAILTEETKLFNLVEVASHGGLTFDVWFKGMPTASSKIIDYAGTLYIGARPGNADGDDNPGELFFSVGNSIVASLVLDADDGLSPDDWNHVLLTYTVTDASNPESLVGDVVVILNDEIRAAFGIAMNSTGDSLDRPTAVGSHPTSVNATTGVRGESYNGLVYNPSGYFGVEPLSQPIFVLISGNAGGFTATITDGASPIVPSSISAKLDGTAITVTVDKADPITTITYAPDAPIPGGAHTVEVTYTAESSTSYTSSASLIAIGSEIRPVLEYRFPASYDGSGEDVAVIDQSPADHNGVLNIPVALSEDVPPGAAAGLASLDLTEGAASVLTEDIDLLTSAKILETGGFTYDIWFKGAPTANLNKLIDFAGTDWLAASTADSDGDGNVGEIVISPGNDYANSLRLDADDGYRPDDWNHAVARFQVTGGTVANLTGTLSLTLNGVTRSLTGRSVTSYGDDLNRPLGIASHPSGGEKYSGLIFNPKVFLGVVPDDSPTAALTANQADGLTITLQDTTKVVAPASIRLALNDTAVTPEIGKADDLTTITLPAAGLAAGAHVATLVFSDEDGDIHQHVLNFAIAGQASAPLFAYSFPASYDGSVDLQEVYDQSAAANDAVADGQNGDAPIPLSTDVPPGAAAGTQSLDLTTDYGALLTNGIKLLNVPSIIGAGGFTIDLWFKGVPTEGTALQKIFDYAGTESISVNANGELVVTLNSAGGTTLRLTEGDGLSLEDWNHVVVTFAVTDETAQASVVGDLTVTLNENPVTVSGWALTTFGDSLNRRTSIGSHPLGGENYRGLVYNPTLSLGAGTVPTGPASITLTRSGNTVTLTYEGILQSSPDLRTAFTTVTGATSPYTITLPASGQLFFRAQAAE